MKTDFSSIYKNKDKYNYSHTSITQYFLDPKNTGSDANIFPMI